MPVEHLPTQNNVRSHHNRFKSRGFSEAATAHHPYIIPHSFMAPHHSITHNSSIEPNISIAPTILMPTGIQSTEPHCANVNKFATGPHRTTFFTMLWHPVPFSSALRVTPLLYSMCPVKSPHYYDHMVTPLNLAQEDNWLKSGNFSWPGGREGSNHHTTCSR